MELSDKVDPKGHYIMDGDTMTDLQILVGCILDSKSANALAIGKQLDKIYCEVQTVEEHTDDLIAKIKGELDDE